MNITINISAEDFTDITTYLSTSKEKVEDTITRVVHAEILHKKLISDHQYRNAGD